MITPHYALPVLPKTWMHDPAARSPTWLPICYFPSLPFCSCLYYRGNKASPVKCAKGISTHTIHKVSTLTGSATYRSSTPGTRACIPCAFS